MVEKIKEGYLFRLPESKYYINPKNPMPRELKLMINDKQVEDFCIAYESDTGSQLNLDPPHINFVVPDDISDELAHYHIEEMYAYWILTIKHQLPDYIELATDGTFLWINYKNKRYNIAVNFSKDLLLTLTPQYVIQNNEITWNQDED